MNWATFKQQLRRLWIVQSKQCLAYLSASGMLNVAFQRQWDDYPWRVTESFHFTCMSTLTDLYIVEKTICKRYLMPNGEVKTEIEQRESWKAVLSASHHLAELGTGNKVIGLIPERMAILFNDREFVKV